MKAVFSVSILLLPLVVGAQLQRYYGPLDNPHQLRSDAVRRELKLSKAQNDKIVGLWTLWITSVEKARASRDKTIITKEDPYRQKLAEDSLAVLSAAQHQRLRQITIQLYTPLYLSHPEIAKAIGLTTDQVRRLESISIAFVKRRVDKNNHESLLLEAKQDSWAVLTAQQKAKLKKISGTPVDLDRIKKGKVMDVKRSTASLSP